MRCHCCRSNVKAFSPENLSDDCRPSDSELIDMKNKLLKELEKLV